MKEAALPYNEEARLKALVELEIMDTAPEKAFDDIVQLASHICETPMSLITLLDEKRQWFKAKVGIDGTDSTRNESFCAHAILDDQLMVVENALLDERFHDNPFVTGNPEVRFYAGIPLTSRDGFRYGALCVIDTVPRTLTPLQKMTLEVLSNQVIKLLEMRVNNRKMQQQGEAIERMNAINAKMLSIIGHDLRSPLSNLYQITGLHAGGDLSPEEALELINETSQSVGESLGLLDNLMTWATQQFKNEAINHKVVNVRSLLEEIAKSFSQKTTAKANTVTIHAPTEDLPLNENVFRLLVRNLMGNANKFTDGGHIDVTAEIDHHMLEVSITDNGKGMTEEQLLGLYNWEKRLGTPGTSGEKGSGIGLKLSKEMLAAAGGSLVVESAPGKGSTFTFTLPLGR